MFKAETIKALERSSNIKAMKGQARKGVWWMPWHQEATKDVVSCEKRRLAASEC